MNCEEVTLLLTARVEPVGDEAASLAAHVAECEDCRMQATYLGWLRRELSTLPRASAPAGLSAAVMRRTRSRAVPSASGPIQVRYSVFATPVGDLFVAYGEQGIVRAAFALAESEFAALLRSESRSATREDDPPRRIVAAVTSFVESGRCRPESFDLRLLGEFERKVLLKALEIPRGEVRSYAWIAREIGQPGAARAVGQALGRNPIPLLIPCHRALRSDGSLGGYAFGLELKRKVLASEGIDLHALARDTDAGIRFHGSRTTGVFCLPTCRHARRIAPENRVALRTTAEARAAGFRPCLVCRPAAAVAG